MPTVVEHVLRRLQEIGVAEVFGVPGDYAFPLNDAICATPGLRWIGCSSELNAAFAADGHARVRGLSALCTVYGVGELSAIGGVAGACAEHLPIFHLVGTPSMAVQASRAVMHHTLGNGEYDLFRGMAAPVVCASAVMTPQTAAAETERLIAAALHHRKPVYMAFPADLATQPILAEASPIAPPRSDPAMLDAAAAAIAEALGKARSAVILPGLLLARCGLQAAAQAVVDAAGIPFAAMMMDKGVLAETHPAFLGIYDGALMNSAVRDAVEGSDAVLMLGALMSDFNTGAFTAHLDPARVIAVGHHRTRVADRVFPNVEIGDLLAALATRLPRRAPSAAVARPAADPVIGAGDDPITAAALYPRWARMLREDDILVAETGTISMGMAFAPLPRGAQFHNQTLWGSIGWATPAAFGAAIAAPQRRAVLITGEGAHQMTAQEIGQFARHGLKPVVFVLNNGGYAIERLLCRDPGIVYNDLAAWRYAELPRALGCDWFTARVTTCGELDAAIERAGDGPAYVEVVTGPMEAPPLAHRLHDSLRTLYRG